MLYCTPTPCKLYSRPYKLGKKDPKPEGIINFAAEYFHISVKDMVSKSRKREIVQARMTVMNVLYVNKGISVTRIGQLFNRDHTTVVNAKKVVANLIETDPNFQAAYNHFVDQLRLEGVVY